MRFCYWLVLFFWGFKKDLFLSRSNKSY
ncbi:hypothetical protein BB466_02560 [Helicobacter pylori]|nr:hypothetical protein BGL86_02075 [Helicobacter pylori]PDX42734.1 hypothetical protein BB466_02560 [Helicobacter pylori]